jgi:hypothetical protein
VGLVLWWAKELVSAWDEMLVVQLGVEMVLEWVHELAGKLVEG